MTRRYKSASPRMSPGVCKSTSTGRAASCPAPASSRENRADSTPALPITSRSPA